MRITSRLFSVGLCSLVACQCAGRVIDDRAHGLFRIRQHREPVGWPSIRYRHHYEVIYSGAPVRAGKSEVFDACHPSPASHPIAVLCDSHEHGAEGTWLITQRGDRLAVEQLSQRTESFLGRWLGARQGTRLHLWFASRLIDVASGEARTPVKPPGVGAAPGAEGPRLVALSPDTAACLWYSVAPESKHHVFTVADTANGAEVDVLVLDPEQHAWLDRDGDGEPGARHEPSWLANRFTWSEKADVSPAECKSGRAACWTIELNPTVVRTRWDNWVQETMEKSGLARLLVEQHPWCVSGCDVGGFEFGAQLETTRHSESLFLLVRDRGGVATIVLEADGGALRGRRSGEILSSSLASTVSEIRSRLARGD